MEFYKAFKMGNRTNKRALDAMYLTRVSNTQFPRLTLSEL